MIMRVIAYIRVSTDGQAADDRFGLLVQRQKITEYCSANDMEIVKWYTDEGESGAKERPGFDEICYGDVPDVEACVVAKSDRVARDINIYFYYKMLLTKKNIKLISVSEDFGIYGAFAPILEAFSMCVAQMERDNITMRTSAGRNAKARQGGWAGGPIPIGYRLVNKQLVVDEREREVVRDIYKMRADGMVFAKIADALNENGITTKNGKRWVPIGVSRVLDKRKFYEGYYQYGNVGFVKGQHEAILEEGEFLGTEINRAPPGRKRIEKPPEPKKPKKPAKAEKKTTLKEISALARDAAAAGMNEDYVRLVIKTNKPHFTESDIKMVLALMKN